MTENSKPDDERRQPMTENATRLKKTQPMRKTQPMKKAQPDDEKRSRVTKVFIVNTQGWYCNSKERRDGFGKK